MGVRVFCGNAASEAAAVLAHPLGWKGGGADTALTYWVEMAKFNLNLNLQAFGA